MTGVKLVIKGKIYRDFKQQQVSKKQQPHHTCCNPTSGVWRGQKIHKPYPYLMDVERLFPKGTQLK